MVQGLFARQENVDLAPLIDHALLVPTATPEQVAQWCADCDRYGFASVCVYPAHVRQAADLLHQRRVAVCTVIGFPTGATTSATKLFEAQEAVENGATELDVVINLGWLKSGQHDALHREVATICEETGQPVKAILETALLTPNEISLAAEICMDSGVAFLKTSTGWQGAQHWKWCGNWRRLPKAGWALKPRAAFTRWPKLWPWCRPEPPALAPHGGQTW